MPNAAVRWGAGSSAFGEACRADNKPQPLGLIACEDLIGCEGIRAERVIRKSLPPRANTYVAPQALVFQRSAVEQIVE